MHQISDRSSTIHSLLPIVIAAFVLCITAQSGRCECQWDTLATAPLAGRVDGMVFIDADTGWCVNSSGQIWHTDDGGANWTKQFQTSNYLRSIAFVDALHGWAGALDGNRLFETTDGGANWTAVTGLPSGSPARVCGMAVLDANTVIACGAYDGTPGYLKTVDAGANWTAHDLSGEASNLIDAWFFDNQNGFLVGGADGAYPDSARAVVLHTQDGGATWTRRYTGTVAGEWGWKLFFLTDQIGFVSLESLPAARILKTVDGGLNWQPYDVPGNMDIQGVGFVDENLGWVGGWEGTSESTDGGVMWSTVNWGLLLNRFVRISSTLAYASGATVYKWTCGPSAVVETKTPVPSSPLALKCYPNPFNPSTTISFEVPTASHVRVRIYDGLGMRVVDLLDAGLPAGPHTVKWNGRDAEGNAVASGVYLYRVDASGTAESRSMVLLK